MGGGLLQLVAYGAQDVYLTGNPQITFFKVVYRRHTNFAIEAIQQTFNGNPAFGQRVTSTIARSGDLINRAYLVVNTAGLTGNLCNYFGLRLINYVEVEIGGQKIDKHYSHWMYIWNELSLPSSKQQGWYEMVGGAGGSAGNTYYVPLEFWFCRNVGLALPLIGLQYHEVKINLLFEDAAACVQDATAITGTFDASLWVDYIYLDTDERRKFAQASHEYLIEQLQFTGKEAAQSKIKLNFNHPCKEIVWVATKQAAQWTDTPEANNNWFNYTTNAAVSSTTVADSAYTSMSAALANHSISSKNPIAKGKLILNGNDRFSERNGNYFNLVQPFQHHENVPSNAGINVYSFALKPEEHQPSGTLNMSRIDTSTLDLTYTSGVSTSTHDMNIYAVNYNVLRILSGMGGIAYSN